MKNYVTYKSPIGLLFLTAENEALTGVHFKKTELYGVKEKETPILLKSKKQLDEYFCGKRKIFDLKLDLSGTDFQKKAWQHLQKIPFGKTRSYGDQAKSAGAAKAVRAIGTANGRNPIAIIVPCHRVIRSDGSLGGYAGGLHIKKFLLELESNS